MDELSQSRLMIQGLNQDGQRAFGKVKIELFINDKESNALFHIIDAKTTYNMLLGRPWIHQNGLVSSTLHQCFKYCRNGEVKTIVADAQPTFDTKQQLKQKGNKVIFEEEEKSLRG